MTMPRQVIPGRTYLITRRCTQRQLLMRPDHVVNAIYLYCLGEAAERYDISLIAWTALSNHHHVVVRDNLGNFPMFLAHLHKMLAKALNAHWGRWENLFATEQPNALYLVDEGARFDRLIYVLTNSVKHHLVDRVTDWPGASSLRQVLSGEPIIVERPIAFFGDDSKMPERVTLRCVRPDGFQCVTADEWRDTVLRAIDEAERAFRIERRELKISVVGRKGVLASKPTDFPHTGVARGGLRPNVASRDPDLRRGALEALREFRDSYRRKFEKWRDRAADVVFPLGTYKLMLFGVPCVVEVVAG